MRGAVLTHTDLEMSL